MADADENDYARRLGMSAGIREERARVLALIDCGLDVDRLRVAVMDGESADEFPPGRRADGWRDISTRNAVIEECVQRLNRHWMSCMQRGDERGDDMAHGLDLGIKSIQALKQEAADDGQGAKP